MTSPLTIRPEQPADIAGIRAANLAAFPAADEADLVEALRAGPAWIEGLSYVAEMAGSIVGHALLTRNHVDGSDSLTADSLTLGPCAVLPAHQRSGVGTRLIEALLDDARRRGEGSVIVLGHAEYYPRFGFRAASSFVVTTSFPVPDGALMAMPLSRGGRVPSGTVVYPPAFGV